MTLETDLLSAESERAVPEGLRARLEAALVSRAWAEAPEAPELADVDAARPVPQPVRARLQGTVAAVAKAALDDADAPRDLPPMLRARLERALVPAIRRRELAVRALAIAASVILLASSSVAVFKGDDALAPGRAPVATDSFGDDIPIVPLPGRATVHPEQVGPPPALSIPDFASGNSGGMGSAPAFELQDPPPFAYGDQVDAAVYLGPPPPPPPRLPSLHLAAIEGDDEQVAGFKAYMEELEAAGGIAGRRSVITREVTDPHDVPEGTLAVVDLSSRGAEGPIGELPAPYFETLATSENALNGSVFSVAGSPERQARIAVAAVFPQRADGTTAVIYRPAEGIFATSIADAFQGELERRGVRVLHVVVEQNTPTLPVPADASFLSLPPGSARQWLADAERADHRPTRGIAGIFSLGDADLLPELPAGTIVASPYALDLPKGEAASLEKRAGRPLNARLIHGWVSAKAVAISLWRSSVEQVEDMPRAVAALSGWDLNFAPYRTRPDSNVRTPDALVHVVKDGRFERVGGWRTDRS